MLLHTAALFSKSVAQRNSLKTLLTKQSVRSSQQALAGALVRPRRGPTAGLFQTLVSRGCRGPECSSHRPPLLMDMAFLPQVSADDAAGSDRGTVFVINFSPALREIINETKYFEQLGFHIPELARNVALQEDKFLR